MAAGPRGAVRSTGGEVMGVTEKRDEPRKPDEEHEALLRRIREFLRHGRAHQEDEIEEWGEFAAQLHYLQEELPDEERRIVLDRWEAALRRVAPDLVLPTAHREQLLLALEAAAAEGAAWAALEQEPPPAGSVDRVAIIRVADWALESDPEHDSIVLAVMDRRTEARFELADPLVLAHLATDVKGLLQSEGPWVPPEPELTAEEFPMLRLNGVAGYACAGYDYRGYRAVALQSGYNGEIFALCLFQPEQLDELLHRAREILRNR